MNQFDSNTREEGIPESEEKNTVSIYLLENVMEAEMLENLLIANGIPCMIRRFYYDDGAFGKALANTNQGWGQIRVFEEDEKQARRIVAEWQNATPQPYEY